MSTSDKAWVWAGMNYSEDETKLEKLAVKFKNTDLAQAFKKCIDETVLKVRKTISELYRVFTCLCLGCRNSSKPQSIKRLGSHYSSGSSRQ